MLFLFLHFSNLTSIENNPNATCIPWKIDFISQTVPLNFLLLWKDIKRYVPFDWSIPGAVTNVVRLKNWYGTNRAPPPWEILSGEFTFSRKTLISWYNQNTARSLGRPFSHLGATGGIYLSLPNDLATWKFQKLLLRWFFLLKKTAFGKARLNLYIQFLMNLDYCDIRIQYCYI